MASILIIATSLVALAVAAVVWKRRRQRQRMRERNAAIMAFPLARPELSAEFLAAAAATGKPRGLRWVSCALDDRAAFGVDRGSGDLYALNGVAISFEAIPGGGMEEVEAVGNIRSATAVFVHRGGRWTTDGRTVFNLEPAAALSHFGQTIAPVAAGVDA